MCLLHVYKDISMRTGLSARGKIDRESDKCDSYPEGLVGVRGSVVAWGRGCYRIQDWLFINFITVFQRLVLLLTVFTTRP